MPDSPCLINPKKARNEPSLDPTALLIPLPGDLQQVAGYLAEDRTLVYKNPLLRVYQDKTGCSRIGLGGPAVGAPQAVMILEKLIVLGVRKVLFFGWTGGLQPHLAPGDLILPDQAISEEGTSRHYAAKRNPRPSPNLFHEIEQLLKEEDWSYVKGPVWTTDALYRETVDKVQRFQTRGVLGVDMETSALFTVGAFRGIEVTALLIVSDDLSGMTWRHGFREPRFIQARARMARLLQRWVNSNPS